MKYGLLLWTTLLLGCSTYSKNECREKDWYLEGKKAALDGYTLKQGKTHLIDKCQEDKGVVVDFVDFERGFKSGLNKVCSPEGLKALEAKGIKYRETCENHSDSLDFEKTRTSELEEKVHSLESEISRVQGENAKLTSEVESLKAKEANCSAPQ